MFHFTVFKEVSREKYRKKGEQCERRLLGVHHENNEAFLMIREEDNVGIKIKKISKGQTS